jgi:AraC-like DNA-binding protein
MHPVANSMTFCRHFPGPPLAAFIEWFWYYDDLSVSHDREHVLPDGTFELIINLQEEPRKLFAHEPDRGHRTFRRGWLSGTHASYLIIDVLKGTSMMGAHFRPGGAAAILGLPAGELANEVIELDLIWGAEAWNWRERMIAAAGSKEKFLVLETFLMERLKIVQREAWPARRIAVALSRLNSQTEFPDIAATAAELGISHKHLIQEFRKVIGLAPKLYCRIQRFQRVLAAINKQKRVEWADVAVSCGYFDQAHFIHDFTAFAGVNPSAYLSHRLEYPGFIRAVE